MTMKRAIVLSALLCGLVLSGCKTMKDVLSWTPFWWVVNLRRVEHPGTLRLQPDVVSTLNYNDGKKRYSYCLDSGVILCRIGNADAASFKPLPGGNPRDCDGTPLRVLRLAADNNRIFIVAENVQGKRSLWWYCVKRDDAKWASILIHAAGDFMKEGYADWFDCAHLHDSAWVNVLALRTFVPYKEPHMEKTRDAHGRTTYKVAAFDAPRSSIDVSDIVDIAVGNWGGTVITYYVLMGSTGSIMYIDEEIIMDRWKEVPNTVMPPKNSPYPLDSTSRIAASNSVVAVYHHRNDTAFVSWIRWDYHNEQDFEYYPLNWCETEWRSVVCPVKNADCVFLTTHWPDDVHDTVWNVPRGIEDKYEEIKKLLPGQVGKTMTRDDWKGCMGNYPTRNISAYFLGCDVVKGDSVWSLDEDNLRYPDLSVHDWHQSPGTEPVRYRGGTR